MKYKPRTFALNSFFASVLMLAVVFTAGCDSSVETGIENEEPLAFPGAEGYGRYTTGGRGGDVYYVTNLEDYTGSETPIPGSLRYGVDRADIENSADRVKPRMILFNVAGTIILKRELRISRGNLTIAGQSAPGDGVCIGGFRVVLNNTENIIVRYVRFRMGDLFPINADGADALWGRRSRDMIIDHCSMSWSTDECVSFYGNENFTLQWCIVSESLNESLHSKGAHGYGGIWGGSKASFHHNLLAHHNSRVPRLGPDGPSTPEGELTDMRNNVFYNYNGNGCYGGEGMNVNIVNNLFIPGPAFTQNDAKRGRIIAIDKKVDDPSFPYINNLWGTFFIDGNVVKGHANATSDNWTYGVYNQISASYSITQEEKDRLRLSEPLFTDVVTTHAPQTAFEQVLGYAGCSLHQDSIDERIIMETILGEQNLPGGFTFRGSKTNAVGMIDSVLDLKPVGAGEDWVPWPVLDPGVPITDSNGDGIPDGWLEEKYPGKKATDLNAAGYTYLEVYLNSLVERITKNQNG